MLGNIISSFLPLKLLIKPNPVMVQSIRNTFILKRRYQPLLHKTGYKPKKLRAKYFIYDTIVNTSVVKRENVEVILKEYVEGIGSKGDIVAMKPTFVYNKLILPGLAEYKTEENLKKFSKTEEDPKDVTHSSPYAQRTINMLEQMTLSVIMNKDHPWTLEPWHIRASLRKAGYYCTDDSIELPEQKISGPDLNKENKEFRVIITINNLEKAKLKCRIHHWSTDPSNRLPYVLEHWKMSAEPLFMDKAD